jgi:sirohydrochlorin ferrochelatase
MPAGIVVFGHGSSVESANRAVCAIADEAARRGGWKLYETAFLECAPLLPDAVEKLVASGADRILILPYFLTPGIHLQRDLPAIVDSLARRHGIPIDVAPPLDGHPDLSGILVARAGEALKPKGTL